jgi:hypothetical protein
MAEKTGFTEKMIYDFDTAGVLEVFLPNLDGWYRVTSREFRSFDGRRRITRPIKPQGRGEIYDIPMTTEEYFGPVFMLGTNMAAPYKGTHTFIESEKSIYFNKQSGSRHG